MNGVIKRWPKNKLVMDLKTPLPVDAVTDDLAMALNAAGAAVLQAPTGTGKTTRVPLALLQQGFAESGQIVMLQPRRVAARASARTMAQSLGEAVGQTVGYQVRFDRKVGRDTKIVVMTEGLLTAKFARDPMLESVSMVILDEFHERSLDSDLALAFLKTLRELRDNLKVLVMSATLQSDRLASYLGDAPVIEVAAPTFPLAITYREHLVTHDWGAAVADGLDTLIADDDDGGDVLVFLPGVGEIERVSEELAPRFSTFEFLPLHGRLTAAEQDRVFEASKKRRVVLATNIAETSLTIPGITNVIDTGYQRQASFDNKRGINRLDLARISQASATQRAGRAGRTAPGRVVRLWSESLQQALESHDVPEVMRLDLTAWLLAIIDYHGPELDDFPFFEAPDEASLAASLNLLRDLGALEQDGRINDKGKRLLQLPLHPRQACLLETAAADGGGTAGAALCAILAEGFRTKGLIQDTVTDLIDGTRRVPRRLQQVFHQLLRQTRGMTRSEDSEKHLGKWALSGFPDRLCCIDEKGEGRMVGGRGVVIAEPRHAGRYVVALDVSERGHNRQAAKVDLWLSVSFAEIEAVLSLQVIEGATFDTQKAMVRGLRTWQFRDLVLKTQPIEKPDDAACGQILAEVASQQFDVLFRPDKDAARLRDRVLFAAKYSKDPDWPDLSHAGICARLPEALFGKRRLDDVRRINWLELFQSWLTWPQQQELNALAPSHIEVPSGSRIALDYSQVDQATGAPILAVRLQEMFGQAQTPTVARGAVRLLIHLLAPNMRPCQVTQDLESFWNNTYAEVRKELRQRYPKHAWPEDPWQAQAIRGTKKRPNANLNRG